MRNLIKKRKRFSIIQGFPNIAKLCELRRNGKQRLNVLTKQNYNKKAKAKAL